MLWVPAFVSSQSVSSTFSAVVNCPSLLPAACRSGAGVEHTSHKRCVSEVLCLVCPLMKELLW